MKLHYFFCSLFLLALLSACVASTGESKTSNRIGCQSTRTKALLKQFPKSGTTYFSWNCDSLTTSIGNVLGVYPGTRLDSSTAWNGSSSMRLDVIGNDNGNQARGVSILNAPTYQNFFDGGYLFYRFAMNIDANFSWGQGTAFIKANRIKRTDDQHPLALTSFLSRDGIFINECPYCNIINQVIPFNFQAMAGKGWHEYIVVMKKQTSRTSFDAELHLFYDGNLVGSITGMHLYSLEAPMAEAWGGWMVAPYFQLNATSRDGGTIWIDDIDTSNFWNSKRTPQSAAVQPATPVQTPTQKPTHASTPSGNMNEEPSNQDEEINEENEDSVVDCR